MLLNPEFKEPPQLPDDVIKYSMAIVKGSAKSVTGFAHMVAHPLDTVVYPVSNLVWDACVISASHYEPILPTENPDFSCLKKMITPTIYNDSKNRMLMRIDNSKKTFDAFTSGSLEYQIETMSELVTSFYLPGTLIKGIKSVKNFNEFAMINPPKFHNHAGAADDIISKFSVKQYSVADIRRVSGWKGFLYVITDNGKIIIMPPNATKPFQRTGKLHDGSNRITTEIYHSDLAQFRPVYSAGEIMVKDGKIIKIDNTSGHYRPKGDHLKSLVENAFLNNGFPEVIGKYSDFLGHYWTVDPIISFEKIKLSPGAVSTVLQNIPDDKPPYFITSEHFDLDEQFIPTDEQKQEFFKQTKAVGLIFQEIKEWDKLSPELKTKLNSASDILFNYGQIGMGLSQIALMTGGHARTWRGVAAASQNVLSLAHGIKSVANASSLTSLSAVTGYVGIAVAGISLAMGLFGDNDGENGMQQIMEELNEIRNAIYAMHKDLIEIGRRLEEILIVCILGELNQINLKLNRLERITAHSFKELHGKELVDIIDTIKKEICGEHVLTNSEKRDYMRRLTTWIDHHSKSQLQTFLIRDGGDKIKMIELLESPDFDIYAMFPLFVNMLSSVYPLEIDITNIPNIKIFSAACEVYTLACRHGYDHNTMLTQRIIDTYNKINLSAEALYKLNIPEILQRQHEYFRFQAGLAIAKCRTDTNEALIKCLIPGQSKEMLMDLLNDMELRRLFLVRFNEIMPCFTDLESKKDVLETLSLKYRPNSNIFELVRGNKVNEFKRALEMGTDPNVWDWWGLPIHYLTKHSLATEKYQENITLHLMFRYPDIQMSGRTRVDCGDTWGQGANPILHVLNLSKYNMAILFCANGFDIDETIYGWQDLNVWNLSHVGNLHQWAATNTNISSVLTLRFVQQMNKNGVLNKTSLRKAYKYYKLCESGFCEEPSDVSQECVLLLTCILGDLLPFTKIFKSSFDINALIPEIGITFRMLAVANNLVNVISYLDSICPPTNIKSTLAFTTNDHTMELAIYSKASLSIEYLQKGKKEYQEIPLYMITDKLKNNLQLENENKITKYINEQIISIKNITECNISNKFNETIDNCKLFHELLKTYKIKHASFTELDKIMKNVNSKNLLSLISAFNKTDAILRVKCPTYNLGTKIDLLIEEIKLLL